MFCRAVSGADTVTQLPDANQGQTQPVSGVGNGPAYQWRPNSGQTVDTSNGTGVVTNQASVDQAKGEESEPIDLSGVELFITKILYYIASAFSALVSVFVAALMEVIKYDHFFDRPVVNEGWIIVRDVCNNFFIIMMLVIAVATVLRIQAYHYKSLLVKLLIAAVLINFSKMFTGIMIDFSQVLMLWFAAPFVKLGGGVVLKALGLQRLFDLSRTSMTGDQAIQATYGGLDFWSIIKDLLFALILSVVAVVVIACIIIVLVYRIVMLWILIILSPIGYVGQAFPKAATFASDWWSRLGKELIIGPLMLFFLYLAFGVAGVNSPDGSISGLTTTTDQSAAGLVGPMMQQPKEFFDYLLIILLLVVSLIIGQSVGAAGSKWAGKGLGLIKGYGKAGLKFGASKAWGAAKGVTKTGAKTIDLGLGMTRLGAPSALIGKFRSKGGAAAGAATFAAIGSLLGPAGTVIGGVGGALLGAAGGKEFMKRLNIRRKNRTNLLKANLAGDKGEFLDESGKETKEAAKAKYEWKEDKGYYVDRVTREVHTDGNDAVVHRFGEYVDQEGKSYRKKEAKGKYLRVNSDGTFFKDENNEEVAAKGAFGVTALKDSGLLSGLSRAYALATSKTSAVKDAAEEEKISKLQKDYQALDNDTLKQLLEIEGDGAKKMAIALTLGLKQGFSKAEDVIKAKETFAGNAALLKRFDEAMNKNNMILNNTRADGTIDKAKITKAVRSGDVKLESQETKQMTPEALKVMAEVLGDKFSDKLDKMIENAEDEKNVKSALQQILAGGQLSFKGADLAIRRVAAEKTGDPAEAFKKVITTASGQKESVIDEAGFMKAIKGFKVKSFAKIKDDLLESGSTNPDAAIFQAKLAANINLSQIMRMSTSDDMNPDKFYKILRIIHDEAYKSGANPETEKLWESLERSSPMAGHLNSAGLT